MTQRSELCNKIISLQFFAATITSTVVGTSVALTCVASADCSVAPATAEAYTHISGGSRMGHLGQMPPPPLQEIAYKIEIL